jgi:hypothetical protein
MQSDDFKTNAQRRKFVKLAAGGVALLPLAALVGCSGDKDTSSAKEAAAAAEEKATEAAAAAKETAKDTAAAAKEMADDTMTAAEDMADEAMAAGKEMADDTMAAAEDMADDTMAAAKDKMEGAKQAMADATGSLPKLSEDDPVAKALGYKHDASKVDASKYPNRGANANCSNCILYVDKAAEAGWGGCSIFAGKAVNANGWCNSYQPKAS